MQRSIGLGPEGKRVRNGRCLSIEAEIMRCQRKRSFITGTRSNSALERVGYSYLSASMGSIRTALRAGQKPKKTPPPIEKSPADTTAMRQTSSGTTEV